MPEFEKYRKRLENRRKYLVTRLENIEDELDQPHNRNWDDDATENEQHEVLEDLGLSG